MKRSNLNLRFGASSKIFQKLSLLFIFVAALELSTAFNADAQRRGGGGGFHGGGGSSHVGVSHSGFYHGPSFGRGFGEFRGAPWRYSYFHPRFGGFYWYLPFPYFNFWYNGWDYSYYNGLYYHHYDGRYESVSAPVGYKVRNLPKGYQEVTVDGTTYYYYYGAFYLPTANNKKFEVVPAPVGAEVDNIPRGADKIVVHGQTYYTLNGVQYKAIERNDQIWYQVTKSRGYESDAPAPAPAPTEKEKNTEPQTQGREL